jgi:hypothetical protein
MNGVNVSGYVLLMLLQQLQQLHVGHFIQNISMQYIHRNLKLHVW